MSDLKQPYTENDHQTGTKNAPVTIVQYGDYECPYSRLGHRFIKKILKDDQIAVSFIFRHFPLKKLHTHAELSAWVAESAANQQKFWEMHNLLFDHNDNLRSDLIMDLAKRLDLDMNRLQKDIDSDKVRSKVRDDIRGGLNSGVKETPAFFINGERYKGELDAPDIKKAIKEEIV
ncbi:DsbA family protein [Balneola sp. MJW-20]|uniref:DsbA family protein n=1 Tax=Gracilimonas aurantiaca TaxID=3234185 RepID=UPI0034663F5E